MEPLHPDLQPFHLTLQTIERLFLVDVHDDPTYRCLEVQTVADPTRGRGMLAILYRRDGRVDVLHEPGVDLDHAVFGPDLHAHQEARFEPGVFETPAIGVRLDVAFFDPEGRSIQLRAEDLDPRGRRPSGFLAPVSGDLRDPIALLIVWMQGFDFVRRSARLEVSVDGVRRTPAGIPIPIDLRRVHLARFAGRTTVVFANRRAAGPARAPGDATARLDDSGALVELVAELGAHRAAWRFVPPVRPLVTLGRPTTGAWTIGVADQQPLIEGRYTLTPGANRTRIELTVDHGWRPQALKPSLRALTRMMPVFRRWPTTYRWEGTMDHHAARLDGRWSRR
jgi:hypothetical protein